MLCTLSPMKMGEGKSLTSGCILKQQKALNEADLCQHPETNIHFGDRHALYLIDACTCKPGPISVKPQVFAEVASFILWLLRAHLRVNSSRQLPWQFSL